MLGVGRTVDGSREDDAATFLQASEGGSPGRMIGREVRTGDRHQPPAGRKTRQRRGDMPPGRVDHAALDIGHDREGRVHQHHARHGAGIEMVVDLGGVEAAGGDGRKEAG